MKRQKYSNILELFLSIEECRCKENVEFGQLFLSFEDFMSTYMIDDLSNKSLSLCHESVLQITAMCLSKLYECELKSMDKIGDLVDILCEYIIDVSSAASTTASKSDEILITALFAMDNCMAPIVKTKSDVMAKMYRVVLSNDYENALVIKYAYDACTTFMADVISIDYPHVIDSLHLPCINHLIHENSLIRHSATKFLGVLPFSWMRRIKTLNEDNVRLLFNFLRLDCYWYSK